MNDIYQAPTSKLTESASEGEYGSLEKGVSGDYEFNFSDVMSEAWSKVSGNKLTFFLAFVIYMVIYMTIIFGVEAIVVASGLPIRNELGGVQLGWGFAIYQILILAVTVPMSTGFYMMGIYGSVGRPLHILQLFQYYGKTGPILLTAILMYILIIIGYVLLILPGIYLTISYVMAMPLVVEKNLSPWQALETSRKAVTKNWFGIFVLAIVLGIILAFSMLPLLIGLIWSMPFAALAMGIVYRNMFGVETQEA